MKRRGTSNSNQRGNTADRKSRKQFLLETFMADAGYGTCRCYRCGELLDELTMTIDRIIPGRRGGTYQRNNIRPACGYCNSARNSSDER